MDSRKDDPDDYEHFLDDDIDDDDINEAIEQANQAKKSKIDELETQQINFQAISRKELPVLPTLKGTSNIFVNPNQKGNPLLKNLNLKFIFTESIDPAHYLLNDNCCAIFLSLKYHISEPNYIYNCITRLQNKYQLQLLILKMDTSIYEQSLKELTILCIKMNFTLLLCWTAEEAARHIENYKFNIDKSPEIIMGENKNNQSKQESLVNALTTVKGINRNDVETLLKKFGSLENVVKANIGQLISPGIQEVKATRLNAFFNKKFIKK